MTYSTFLGNLQYLRGTVHQSCVCLHIFVKLDKRSLTFLSEFKRLRCECGSNKRNFVVSDAFAFRWNLSVQYLSKIHFSYDKAKFFWTHTRIKFAKLSARSKHLVFSCGYAYVAGKRRTWQSSKQDTRLQWKICRRLKPSLTKNSGNLTRFKRCTTKQCSRNRFDFCDSVYACFFYSPLEQRRAYKKFDRETEFTVAFCFMHMQVRQVC